MVIAVVLVAEMHSREGYMKKLFYILIGIVVIGGSGCGKVGREVPRQPGQIHNEDIIKEPISHGEPIPSIEEQIEAYIQNMSTREKIGQLLMPAFRTSQYGEGVDVFTEDMKNIIDQYQVGGVILFRENIKTPEQTKLLIKDLQDSSSIPLWMGVDEEGGLVSRIAANPDMGVEPVGSAFEIGKTGEPGQAYEMGKQLAQMVKELGFNMDFAPVADIWSNPSNTVIGKRSFGQDPWQVSEMATQVMGALQEEKIVPVIKHFPGHGDTQEDTHVGRAFVNRSIDELFQRELIPFQKSIEAGADAMMVAHVELPQIDEGIPATLSHTIITDILKTQMGFKGLIITDALDMNAITNQFGKGEAPLQSFMAGTDILLMPDIEAAYNELLKAYEANIITDERLNESVYKILFTKYKYGILEKEFFE